jgi:hypothetical protein
VAVVAANALAAGTSPQPQGYIVKDLENPDGSAAEMLEPALQYGQSPLEAHFLVNTAGNSTLVIWAIDPDHPGEIYRAGVPVMPFVHPKLAEQRPHAEIAHPQLIHPLNAGANVLKAVFRNGKLHACWQDSKPDDSRQIRFIRLARVDISALPQGIPTGSGMIDRRFGKNAATDPPGTVCSYYMPTLAVNASGTMVVNYCRCGPDVFPEARYSVYLDGAADIQPSHLVRKGDYPVGSEDPEYNKPIAEREWARAAVLDYIGIAVDPEDDRSVWIVNAVGARQSEGIGHYELVARKIIPPEP